MNIQLSGRLGDIQAVVKEFVDGDQSLLVKVIRRLAVEDLLDEHFAQRDGQLIDQTADTQFGICDDVPVIKEYLADIR